jgi:hypothetical protein
MVKRWSRGTRESAVGTGTGEEGQRGFVGGPNALDGGGLETRVVEVWR